MRENYSADGLCNAFGKGHQNFEQAKIVDNLRPFFTDGWYLNIHDNGDMAIMNVIGAYKTLGAESPQNRNVPLVLIHSTVNTDVNGSDTVEAIAEARQTLRNLSVSHLIAHVAYRGESMKNELGMTRGENIDPAAREWSMGIPVSLHSDSPVSPLYPLWFVEQAATRLTWRYPDLAANEARPLVDNQTIQECQRQGECLSPYRGLMAVTTHAAQQHKLDRLGSIERQKVADLVILDRNPLTQPLTEIHNIPVACTFINGNKVQWQGGAPNTIHSACKLSRLPSF